MPVNEPPQNTPMVSPLTKSILNSFQNASADGNQPCITQLISRLFDTIATSDFYPSLHALLRALANFTEIAVIIFRANMIPSSPYFIDANKSEQASSAFLEGLFRQSPFFNFVRKGGRGFVLLSEVAPTGFYESYFYKECMLPMRLKDDAVFAIHDEGVDYWVCLGRSDAMPMYAREDVKGLIELSPIIERAVINHERLLNQSATEVLEYCTSLGTLDDKLREFTSHVLTDREREIVAYLIRGYSSKACARALDISPSTERVHRKNIYMKLGVNSQSELLATIFDKLFA